MDIRSEVEEAFELQADELKQELPTLLEKLDEHVMDLVDNNPELIPRLFEKMDEIDAGELAQDSPEVANQFQNFLWDTTEEFISQDEEMQSRIDVDITVNFEADDSPMEGHLTVNSERSTIEGGTETVAGAELTITAETDTLIDLLTGKVDPVQGFITRKYTMDGSPSVGIKLVPILKAMADKYTGV